MDNYFDSPSLPESLEEDELTENIGYWNPWLLSDAPLEEGAWSEDEEIAHVAFQQDFFLFMNPVLSTHISSATSLCNGVVQYGIGVYYDGPAEPEVKERVPRSQQSPLKALFWVSCTLEGASGGDGHQSAESKRVGYICPGCSSSDSDPHRYHSPHIDH